MKKLLPLIILFSGCLGHQKGLTNTRIQDRACIGNICAVVADPELVDIRCTRRAMAWKKCEGDNPPARCFNRPGKWDSGAPREGSTSTAAACTVLRPRPGDEGVRYWVWISEKYMLSWLHELGHIIIYEDDGRVFIPENHKALHGFGLGEHKTKKRL